MANLTVEQLVAAGGREWTGGGNHRVYFNDLAPLYGLEVSHYGTGNVRGAKLDGREISNTKAKQILAGLAPAKFWFDVAAGEFRSTGLSETTIAKITAALTARMGA